MVGMINDLNSIRIVMETINNLIAVSGITILGQLRYGEVLH